MNEVTQPFAILIMSGPIRVKHFSTKDELRGAYLTLEKQGLQLKTMHYHAIAKTWSEMEAIA